MHARLTEAVFSLARSLKQLPSGYQPSTDLFPPIDTNAIADKLDLERRGRARGADEQPPSTATQLDDVEHEVRAIIQSEVKHAVDLHANRWAAWTDFLRSLDLYAKPAEIQLAAVNAEAQFKTAVLRGTNEVELVERQALEHQAALEAFRQRHRLERPAAYPDSRILQIGIALVLMAVESVLNLVFFAEGSEFGLIGGLLEALALSALNVLPALLVGHLFLREMFHRNPVRKFLGFCCTGAWAAVVVALNLLAAHYRDALAGPTPEQADAIAVAMLTAWPLPPPESTMSIMLLALGLFFAWFALLDGFWMDDRYPGYGGIARRHERAVADLVDASDGFITRLEDERLEVREALEAFLGFLGRAPGELARILAGRRRLNQELEQHLSYLDAQAMLLVQRYREANRQARSTPPPNHFQRPLALERPILEPADGDIDSERIEEQITEVRELVEGAIDRIARAFDDALSKVQGVRRTLATPSSRNGRAAHGQ